MLINVKIIVDAMGGDNAPDEIIIGSLDCLQQPGVEIILVGRGEDILRVIERTGHDNLPCGVEIVHASEVIGLEDDPANAVRIKKDSSLAVALNLLRDGYGDALVSAGSTGALLSGATLIVKRVRGIRRAALAPFIPNAAKGFLLIDCGANVECTQEYLMQFAFMGSLYMEHLKKTDAPRIGLLNNGVEYNKGTPLLVETYKLLEKAGQCGYLNFVGNVEAKDAMGDACDVLVCDGFTGNIFLKSLEGMAALIMSELKGIYTKSPITKLSAVAIRKHMSALKTKMNPDTIGGTTLLGISKPVIKAHGSSKAAAIAGAIHQATEAIDSDIESQLLTNIDKMKIIP